MTDEVWTIQDLNDGLCELEDLGKSKPPPENSAGAIDLAPIDTALPFDEKVRRGLEKHLDEVGYDSIWRDNPDAVARAVVKVIAPPRPAVQISPAFGPIANPFPWVTAERIRAMNNIEVGADIRRADWAKQLPPPDDETKH